VPINPIEQRLSLRNEQRFECACIGIRGETVDHNVIRRNSWPPILRTPMLIHAGAEIARRTDIEKTPGVIEQSIDTEGKLTI
jgi:hypothetical protein